MPGKSNMTQDGAQPTATNTLILTNVPPQTFAKAGNNDGTTGYSAVKKILEEVGGGIKTVVLLKSFRRILVVYDATSSSQRARRYIQSHPFILSSNPPPADYSGVCVYFGDHTPTDSISSDPGARAPHINYLQVPETEKNFLLSPPGSPPIDWVQIREHSPVMGGHGDALWLDEARERMRELDGDMFMLDDGSGDDGHASLPRHPKGQNAGLPTSTADPDTPGRHILNFNNEETVQAEGVSTPLLRPGLSSHSSFMSTASTDSLPVIIVDDMDIRRRAAAGLSIDDDGDADRTGERNRRPKDMPRTALPPRTSTPVPPA